MIDSPSAIKMIRAVPFGEVLRRYPPAAPDADDDRAEVVDRKRDHPHRDPLVPLEEAG
jgi:hypothetical protein